MREDLFERAGLVCPRCRRPGEGGMLHAPLRVRKAGRREGGFLLEGLLECADPRCGARYPVLDGVPVVLRDVGAWWSMARPALSGVRSAGPEIRGYFDALDDGGSAGIDRRSLLGSYMDFHYSEFADAFGKPSPCADASNGAYWEKAVGLGRPGNGEKLPLSVDLGCSVGRYAFELAGYSDLAVGVDIDFAKVSAAARIQRGRGISYGRRERGRVFRIVEGSWDAPQNVLFLVGDALDPPFPAESFDLVGALNLLDNVGVPLILLGQADALLRRGGILVLGAPYEWRTEIADPAEWLETDALGPAAFLRRLLEGEEAGRTAFRYSVEEEIGEVPWAIRGHARRWTVFLSHMMRARKKNGPDPVAA